MMSNRSIFEKTGVKCFDCDCAHRNKLSDRFNKLLPAFKALFKIVMTVSSISEPSSSITKSLIDTNDAIGDLKS